MIKTINVVAGVILCDDKILIAQRKKGKLHELLWEFPGGKIEAGETMEECLKREIKEEFDLDIKVGKQLMQTHHLYETEDVTLTTFFAFCTTPHINQSTLPAHEQSQWIYPTNFKNYQFTAADHPIIAKLKTLTI